MTHLQNQPIASILIPARNRAPYLKFTIQSALDLPCDLIEIIVSENYGTDESWELAKGFSDPRLKVLRPRHPLPMHEHWEFLLDNATGRWITFLGDDDLVLPYAIDLILAVEEHFPGIEAISSRRANLIWPGAYGHVCGSFSVAADSSFLFHDSKIELARTIDCIKEYLYLPQIYSGGFQKSTLIQRVRNSQGGKYFMSAVPDAYSCLMSLVNTYRYIELGVPLVWIGTSPSSDSVPNLKVAKNRSEDYLSMLSSSSIRLNESFSKEYNSWSLFVHFYEAVSACGCMKHHISFSKIQRLIYRSVLFLLMKNRPLHAKVLASSFGILFPSPWRLRVTRLMILVDKLRYNLLDYLSPVNPLNRSLRCVSNPSAIEFKTEYSYLDDSIISSVNDRLVLLASELNDRLKRLPRPSAVILRFPPWDPRSIGK